MTNQQLESMLARLLIPMVCLCLTWNLASAQTHGLRFCSERRLEVMPVLFVPSDNTSMTAEAIQRISSLVYAHLELTQRRYKELLQTDTFKIADGSLNIYRSAKPHSYYVPPSFSQSQAWAQAHPPETHGVASVENLGTIMAVRELLEWRHDNRYDSKFIYLIIYARPGAPAVRGKDPWFGGVADGFNGVPNSGGGFVGMELSSLLSDQPYAFQSTFTHELGHAFGLQHSNCYGYEMETNRGIMAYNVGLWTKGLAPVAGIFNPEDYFVLAKNKLAFPSFRYVPSVHNPMMKKMDRTETCYLGIQPKYVGEFRPAPPGVGYELMFAGNRVSSGEGVFWSLKSAKANCRYNKTVRNDVKVECFFDGKPFEPGPAPIAPGLAGSWCDEQNVPASITQSENTLKFSTRGANTSGYFSSNDFEIYDMVVADEWEDGLPAFISADGRRLDWANGSIWVRTPCGPGR